MDLQKKPHEKTIHTRRESLIDAFPNVDPNQFTPIYQTQKYIKAEERSLTENKIYV